MRYNYFSSLVIVIALASCHLGCKKVSSRQDLENIQQLEEKAEKERAELILGEADTSLLGELGRAYLNFADNYPEAVQTPEFLFRAGELYSNDLGNMNKAVAIFQRNYQSYPDHQTASNALFLLGYLNHNVLQDLVKAERFYKEFLEKYPDHKMAQTAKFELDHLGQSPEEVFQSFSQPKDTAAVDSILP